jgi:Mg-chelatase subunit ChlD
MKMQNAFQAYFQQKGESSEKAFSVVKLFTDTQVEVGSFHFIFVLDESGSMTGQPWNDLVRAYQEFLNQRSNDQGGNDIVSVIQFASGANIIYQCQPVHLATRSLTFHSVGTVYLAGLQAADQVLSYDQTQTSIVMIFMSDGGDGGSDPLPTLRQMRERYVRRNFVCQTVAFGPYCQGGAEQLLSNMATSTGGRLHKAISGMDLIATFKSIAGDCNVSGTLIERFGEILSREINMKIAIDYL